MDTWGDKRALEEEETVSVAGRRNGMLWGALGVIGADCTCVHFESCSRRHSSIVTTSNSGGFVVR